MFRKRTALCLAVFLGASVVASAQTGEGGLRGYVRDEQGAALPGATVTASSPELLAPVSAVTDAEGYYRLINLRPGVYTLGVAMSGFAGTRRTGIVIRAGNTFAVDFSLRLGGREETVEVAGESPVLEVSRSGNVLNFDGDLQRQLPLQARRNWSDFLDLTPGVISRSFDDGSGRQVYFGHGTEHFAHVIQLEGMIASNYHDAQVTYVAMGADMVGDVQVKTGGVDASAPMGTGMVMNVVTKSGGNQLRGSVAYAYQPFGWNDDNAGNCTVSVSCDPAKAALGTPTTANVRQLDLSLGGPIRKDQVWFFASARRASSSSGISRTGREVDLLHTFFPDNALFDNTSESWQPYLKLTARLAPGHEVSAYYQRDRLELSGNREYNYEPIMVQSTGGSLYGAKLTSVWGRSTTTTLTASYNNKGGNDLATFNGGLPGPQIILHRTANVQANTVRGSGRLLEGGNLQNYALQPASQLVVRGDLTYFKQGWGGSHELQTGFFAAPRNRYDQETIYVNDGFVLEERRMVDPDNAGAGFVPFHRRYQRPVRLQTRAARDSDLGLYVQDTWRPHPRVTLNLGVRADFVRRWDDIFEIERQKSTEIGPRLGLTYMLTADARTILRGSYVRVHEQVMGRDAVTLFGADARAEQIDVYDLDGDGRFDDEQPVLTAARAAALAAGEFDPALHQPFVDEFIVGVRRQFPGQLSVDLAGIKRSYKHNYARVDINGIYPDGPGQPFGGFGRVDPSRGIIFQQTNNRWSTLEYAAVELTVAKSFSRTFQFIGGFNRQWQHFGGTWNPTDPARFLQPEAFASDRLLYMPRGNNEENSLPLETGTNVHAYGPTWQKYSLRLGGTWNAPAGLRVAATFRMVAGPWSGPIVDLLPADDPQVTRFGPARMSNGQSNPLATRMRFVFQNRGEGQVQAPAVKTVGLALSKRIALGGTREVEAGVSAFNLLNEGNYYQYNYSGANERFNPNYLQMRNQQEARAIQATLVLRF